MFIYDEKNIKREDSLPLVEFTENNINDLKFPTVIHKFYFDLRDYQSQRHCLCIDHEGNMDLFEQIEDINIVITRLEEIFNNYMNDKHLIMMIKRPIVRTLDELPKLRTCLLQLLETRSKLKM